MTSAQYIAKMPRLAYASFIIRASKAGRSIWEQAAFDLNEQRRLDETRILLNNPAACWAAIGKRAKAHGRWTVRS